MLSEYIRENKSLFSTLREILGEGFDEFLDYITSFKLRPYIRANTLKIEPERLKQRLEGKGFVLKETILNYAFRVDYYPSELGKTLEHFLGYYYVQDLASMLPAHILNPKKHSYVLDIASAPGSKTTLLSMLMENTGFILANDYSMDRTKATVNNVERLGCLNVVISISKGEKLVKYYKNYFDYALVDAPCTSLGTLHKNPEVIRWWSPREVNVMAKTQLNLLLAAYEMLKDGGTLVYSTCTLTYEENEEVVERFLKMSGAKVEEIRLNIGEVYGGIRGTVRLYPHKTQTEGFFMAKFKKV
ncbi:MAG: RsmB/NOP family class I SAM-dependent RNA methyltransferase [candidate division WOR-3 bacterium]